MFHCSFYNNFGFDAATGAPFKPLGFRGARLQSRSLHKASFAAKILTFPNPRLQTSAIYFLKTPPSRSRENSFVFFTIVDFFWLFSTFATLSTVADAKPAGTPFVETPSKPASHHVALRNFTSSKYTPGMKKPLSSLPLFLLAILSVFLTACSNDEYKNVVPADATMVVSLNLQAFAQDDVDLNSSDAFSQFENVLDEIPNEDLRDKISEIFEDPASLGIDLRRPIYGFATKDQFIGFTMKVYKEKKVDKVFEFFSDQSWCEDVEEEDGLKFTTLFESLAVVYDGDLLVGIIDTQENASERQLRRKLTKLIEQESSDRFFDADNPFDSVDEKAFCCTYTNGNFINYYEGRDRRDIEELNANLKKATGLRITDLSIFTSYKFEGSELISQIQLLGNDDKALEKLEKLLACFQPLKGDYATFFPGEGSAIYAIGIDGKQLLKTLDKTTRGITGANLRQNLDNAARETGVPIIDIFNALNGDVALTLTDYYSQYWYNDPKFAVYASFTDTKFTNDVIAAFRNEDVPVEDLGGGSYRLGSEYDNPIIYAQVYKDKIYTTNSYFDSRQGNDDLKAKMKGKKLYIYVDLPNQLVDKLYGLVKTVTVSSDDMLKYEIRIAPEDDSTGFLEQCLEALDKTISMYFDNSSYSSSSRRYYDDSEEVAEEVAEEVVEEDYYYDDYYDYE